MYKYTKYILGLVFIVITVLLQTTLFQALAINHVSPNLFIATIIAMSALRGRQEGMAYGLVFGLYQDILYGKVVGFYVLIYVVVAIMGSYIYENYYSESMVLPLSFMAIADFMYNLYIFVFSYMFRGRLDVNYYLTRIIIPEMTYTVVIGILLYRLYIIYAAWLYARESVYSQEEDNHERNL